MPPRTLLLFAAAILAAAPAPARAQSPADSATRAAANPADVKWMQGMIHHHAQAVLIAGWAPSHGASASVQTLCARIIVSQRDEIALMSRWLDKRGQSVPAPDSMDLMMPEMDAAAMMPGMLSASQLARLDAARGAEFDRLFLQYMIQHHQGAIVMVNQLFASGAGEENSVYKLASAIYADQTTEIARMQQMLKQIVLAPDPTGR